MGFPGESKATKGFVRNLRAQVIIVLLAPCTGLYIQTEEKLNEQVLLVD